MPFGAGYWREGLRRSATARLALFGARLSLEGVMPKVAWALGACIVASMVLVAIAVGREGPRAPLDLLPSVTSSALAWSAGILFCVAAGSRALRRDRDVGILELWRYRGESETAYVLARAFGLGMALALLVGGGSLLAGIAAALAAKTSALALLALQGALASSIYGLAFALVMAPLSLALLGSRSRAGGSIWFVVLLFVPELLVSAMGDLLPETWQNVLSIPSALASLRGALMPRHVDLLQFVRAAFVVSVVSALALSYLRKAVRT